MISAFTYFWQLNKKRISVLSSVFTTSFFLVFYHASHEREAIMAIYFTAAMYLFLWLVFFYPVVNSFVVIERLTKDKSEYSVIPLFDSDYTIGLQNEKSWLLFTTPCINGFISGFPVTIYFTSSDKSAWSTITFLFSPLMRQNSKRIFSTGISFKMYLEKRLQKDVKPDVLNCIARAKYEGLTSGSGRAISTGHYEAYSD